VNLRNWYEKVEGTPKKNNNLLRRDVKEKGTADGIGMFELTKTSPLSIYPARTLCTAVLQGIVSLTYRGPRAGLAMLRVTRSPRDRRDSGPIGYEL